MLQDIYFISIHYFQTNCSTVKFYFPLPINIYFSSGFFCKRRKKQFILYQYNPFRKFTSQSTSIFSCQWIYIFSSRFSVKTIYFISMHSFQKVCPTVKFNFPLSILFHPVFFSVKMKAKIIHPCQSSTRSHKCLIDWL